ncbi:RNA polymerase sigma factor [Chloroflexi bacterium TSY]|nr:RNA polymerase sigma factor [Chloroflexi bacterium TSY]
MKTRDESVLSDEELLLHARNGNIRAFHTLFAQFQPQLKSYLYRLLANRNDMEDMAQDVFIAAFENIKTFRGESTLKSWVFTIATNKARRHLKNENRWAPDTMERTRDHAHAHPDVMELLHQTNRLSPQGTYEVREHIDYCFTCVSKMLPLKEQIVLILVDVYRFKIADVSQILDVGVGAIKHLLRNARQTMIRIFDDTCALVHKKGVCDQCSQLNGRFNPEQDRQAEVMKIKWVKERDKHNTEELLRLRTALVREIDPLQATGSDLHELFLKFNYTVNQN